MIQYINIIIAIINLLFITVTDPNKYKLYSQITYSFTLY